MLRAEDHRCEIGRIETSSGHDLAPQLRLKGSEPHATPPISSEDELHRPGTQAALPIEEEQGSIVVFRGAVHRGESIGS